MGGGLMQLVAYGAQDIYLTGNPQITFFKVVYRRHTNFSMEAIEQTFNGTADFGKRVTCTVSRNGDLIHRIYLQVTLPSVESTVSSQFFRWVNYVGHMLIKQVEVEIGGQRIDKHYGDWLNVWNELTCPCGLKSGYDNMVGNTVALTGTGLQCTEATTLYVPLQFWFCRNPGLALPLIALQYHEVKINLEFRPKNELYVTTGTSSPCGVSTSGLDAFCVPSLEYASLYIDYIYLDTDERRRFAQTSHEYLIEQLQFTGDESTVNTNVKVKLNFNHPCKELVWVVQRDDVVKMGYNQWNNYTDDFDMDSGPGTLTTDGLPNPNQLVFSNVESDSNVFPFVGVSGVDPEYLQYLRESGVLTDPGSIGTGTDLANGWTTDGHVAGVGGRLQTGPQVRQLHLPSGPGANASNLAPTDFSALTTAGDYSDHAGFGPLRAGRNPVVRAKLQLNGHDRFQERLGSYFNLVQPFQHHTNIPITGINVYSFALKPEEHQPSGTCNMSRIDSAVLQLQLTPKAALGSKIRVYATNYNVLRIMSGMGGLAYSN